MQSYLPDTNVLVTRWLSAGGSAELIDLMPVVAEAGPRVVRRVRATRGRVTVRVRCRPRPDYARQAGRAEACDGGVRFVTDGGPALRLTATVPVAADGPDATAEFTLDRGQAADLVLDGGDGPAADAGTVGRWFDRTVAYWREWAGQSTYTGRWREAVNRSALVMKLLTSREHGSVVAAATFGLPEAAGGGRNWDYRATWIRDASFTMYAFLRLGYRAEAVDYFLGGWRAPASRRRPGARRAALQIMYGLDGRRDLPEQVLDHLAGYGGARPVRIGNAAHEQLQLDIYGELLDSGYLVNKYAQAIAHDGWQHVVPRPSSTCAGTGGSRTRASGRCGASRRSSCTRGSCAGWRSTGPCGWRTSGRCRPRSSGGTPSGARSTPTCGRTSGPTRAAGTSSRAGAGRRWTGRC